MSVEVLGIRHHGPGSSKAVLSFLNVYKPDLILVEGPPDADSILSLTSDKAFQPPVSLLCYDTNDPHKALFYPFAEFSPEWQAIQYALSNKIDAKFMDLPLKHKFPLMDVEEPKEETEGLAEQVKELPNVEPFKYLAEIAGFEDGEVWWEYTFEQRENTENSFHAIEEAISSLRSEFTETNRIDLYREAYMRKIIRENEKTYKNIAVVCGAWHTVAIKDRSSNKKEDEALLKKLPQTKVECTWIPWTFGRLTLKSGYGAGVRSPGWYEHLWKTKKDQTTSWLVKVAKNFRKKHLDISTAHIIETVRLSEALASIRELPRPGLLELNEAAQSVLFMGDPKPIGLIYKELIVSEKIGKVPDNLPKVPLLSDFEKLQKKYRLELSAERKTIEFDLREETQLEKSKFLHRLNLLGIQWARLERTSGKGTFKEKWTLKWMPEITIQVIERAIYGNTIEDASIQLLEKQMKETDSVSWVSARIELVMLADLPTVLSNLVKRLDVLAAISNDIPDLMQSVPGLIFLSRYGDVRKTKLADVETVLDSLMVRITIGLVNYCYSLDDESSEKVTEQIIAMNAALQTYQNENYLSRWVSCLKSILDSSNIHGIIKGRVTRILYDANQYSAEAISSLVSLTLSNSIAPLYSAYWIEGFLKDSGTILVVDNVLFGIIDSWVASLEKELFISLLPLLRRTFSSFTAPEKRQLGEKARGVSPTTKVSHLEESFDAIKAKSSIQVTYTILGIKQ
jgi:hypothetical protein